MHELLEHFEDSHALMLDSHARSDYPSLSPITPSSATSTHSGSDLATVYSQNSSPVESSQYSYSATETSLALSHSRSTHLGKPFAPLSSPYGYSYNYSQCSGYGLLEDEYDPFGFRNSASDLSSSTLEPDSAVSSPLLPPSSTPSSSSSPSIYDYPSAPSPFSTPGSSVSARSVYSSPSLGHGGSLPLPSYMQQSPIYAPQPLHREGHAGSMPTTSLPMIERQDVTRMLHRSQSTSSLLQRKRQGQEPYAISPSISRSRPQEHSFMSGPHRQEKITANEKSKKGVEKNKKNKDGRVKAYRCPVSTARLRCS